MVKECPVIINNDAVTVVRFDGNDIQFPSVRQEGIKTLNVKFENGNYSIVTNEVDDESVDETEPVKVGNKKNKKTIKKKFDEVVED